MTALTKPPSDARPLPSHASHDSSGRHGPRTVCRKLGGKGLSSARPAPARHQPARHDLVDERVGEMVPPVAVDVEEPLANPLLAEPELIDNPAAREVLRPDV